MKCKKCLEEMNEIDSYEGFCIYCTETNIRYEL